MSEQTLNNSLRAAAEAVQATPLNISSASRIGSNGLQNADSVARNAILAFLLAVSVREVAAAIENSRDGYITPADCPKAAKKVLKRLIELAEGENGR